MIIRCLDFETTGFPPNAGVCEVGWTDVIVNGADVQILPTVSLLCKPGMPISPGAMAVHGITDEDVAGQPPTTERFMRVMSGADVFCAHNAAFERQFFEGGDTPWICTYKVALELIDGLPNYKNGDIPRHLGIDLDPARCAPLHRAGPDTYITAKILEFFLLNGCQPEKMVEISLRAKVVRKMTFGKHNGEMIADLPDSYLQWGRYNLSIPEFRAAFEAEIKRRASL